jgi:hypothetical protein
VFPPPSITPPALEDWEFYYNGLTFGNETAWGILKIEGLDLASIRHGDVNLPRDHGQLKGLDLYEDRNIIFDMWVKSDGTSLQHAQLALAAASVVQPNEEPPLWFQLPNLPVMCVLCRPRKRPASYDSDYAAAQILKPELGLHASDPRIYGVGEETALTRGTTTAITNEGNTEMRPIAIFTGPLARPLVGNNSITGDPYIELINPEAEEAEELTRTKREQEEAANRAFWEEEYVKGDINKTELEEKIAAQKVTREAAELEEKEKLEKREEKEEKGEHLAVQAGDQLLVDLSTPHLALYYPGGITANKPENVMQWVTPGSTWWDILPDVNDIYFSSFETTTTGTAALQAASAWQL